MGLLRSAQIERLGQSIDPVGEPAEGSLRQYPASQAEGWPGTPATTANFVVNNISNPSGGAPGAATSNPSAGLDGAWGIAIDGAFTYIAEKSLPNVSNHGGGAAMTALQAAVLMGFMSPVPAQATTAELIEKLGEPDVTIREAAAEALLDRGGSALPALEGAANHQDPEVRLRSAGLVREIRRRPRARALEAFISRDLLRECPAIGLIATSEDQEAWAGLLEDLTGLARVGDQLTGHCLAGAVIRRFRSTTRRDLLVLVLTYLDGDWRNDYVEGYLYGLCRELNVALTDRVREAEKKFTGAGNKVPRIPQVAMGGGCGTLETPIDDLRGDDALRNVLDDLHSDERARRVRALLALLEHKDPGVRVDAAQRLGRMGASEAAGALASRLEDPVSWVAGTAAQLLAEFRSPGALDALHRKAEAADGGLRASVMAALGTWGDSKSVPLLEAALRDVVPGVRLNALAGLIQMGATKSAPHVRPLLKDPDPRVRTAAILAAGELGTAEVAESLLPLVDDLEHRNVAIRALGFLKARGAVGRILPRLDDISEETRLEAALALTLLGAPELEGCLRVLDEAASQVAVGRWGQMRFPSRTGMSPDRFFIEMNRLLFPSETQRLLQARLPGRHYGCERREALRLWGEATGFALVMEHPARGNGGVGFDLSRSGTRALVDILAWLDPGVGTSLILEEGGKIRIVGVEAAALHWRTVLTKRASKRSRQSDPGGPPFNE